MRHKFLVLTMQKDYKKAELPQRWPRDAPYVCVPWKFSRVPEYAHGYYSLLCRSFFGSVDSSTWGRTNSRGGLFRTDPLHQQTHFCLILFGILYITWNGFRRRLQNSPLEVKIYFNFKVFLLLFPAKRPMQFNATAIMILFQHIK